MNIELLKRILNYTKPYRKYLILSLLCAVISVILTLMGPVLIGDAVDLIIGVDNVRFAELPKVLITFLCTFLGSSVFQWCMAYFNNLITYKTAKDLRTQMFGKINKLPLKFIDTTPHGDIINRVINDIDMVSDALLKGFTQLFTGITTILGTLIFMMITDWRISIAVVLLTPVSLFAASFIAKGSYKYFSRQTVTQGHLTGYINEYIANMRLVKTFNHESQSQIGFEKINSELHDCGLNAQFYSALTNPCTRFVNSLVYAATGIIGAVSAISGRITVGQISMFLSYANQYTKPFNEISGIATQLQSAFASAKRVFDIIDQREETDDAQIHFSSRTCNGDVRFKNVSFSYEKNKKFIEGLNLSVKSGKRIAIVGPTGCGKTTLINLLMRFYEINSGEISIDGVNINDMPRRDLRHNFGMVLQDTWLFTGTVRENIAYGLGIEKASDEAIKNAAERAHAHGFIEKLAHGYDTVISEDGGNLSYGQKQLLNIARVMMVDTPMLILDEATSNIDTRTEILIQRAFSEMMVGRTSFIVAHRLSTIREADLILVMKDGMIIEQGKHEELIGINGFYSQLFNAMSG